jgi:hypothetical protein
VQSPRGRLDPEFCRLALRPPNGQFERQKILATHIYFLMGISLCVLYALGKQLYGIFISICGNTITPADGRINLVN